MPAGPCTGALRRKLPTGHPSEAGPPGHRSISGARCTWSTRVLPAACPTPRGHPAKSSGRVQGSTPRKEPGRRFGGGTVAPAGGGRRGCHGASGHGRAGVPSLATGATGATKSAAPDTPAPVPQPGRRGVPLGIRRGGPRGGHRRRGGRRGSPLVVELREVGGEGRILGRPAVEDASTRPCEERRPSTWERRGFPLPAGGPARRRPSAAPHVRGVAHGGASRRSGTSGCPPRGPFLELS